MSRKGLLTRCEGRCPGRRSQSGHHRSGQYRSGRLGNRARSGTEAPEETFFLRDKRRHSPAHRGLHHIVVGKLQVSLRCRLTAHKGFFRHKSYRARNIAVRIIEVLDINVVQTRAITSVGCNIGLMRTKRKPTDASARGLVGAPSCTSNKCHYRGRINWVAVMSPGHPRPGVVAKCPATTVERRKAPREHRRSRSNPRDPPRPSARSGTAPIRPPLSASTLVHNPRHHSSFRTGPGLRPHQFHQERYTERRRCGLPF